MLIYTFTDSVAETFQDTTRNQKNPNGFITLEVLRSDRTPIPKVAVLIYTESGGKAVTDRVLNTGVDGRTEAIPFSVPVKNFQQGKTAIDVPFLKFTIRLELEGFYTSIFRDVHIFADATTLQTIIMDPLPFGIKNTPSESTEILPGSVL